MYKYRVELTSMYATNGSTFKKSIWLRYSYLRKGRLWRAINVGFGQTRGLGSSLRVRVGQIPKLFTAGLYQIIANTESS